MPRQSLPPEFGADPLPGNGVTVEVGFKRWKEISGLMSMHMSEGMLFQDVSGTVFVARAALGCGPACASAALGRGSVESLSLLF